MIVRNEARNLAACLEPVIGLFDEAIVVDTGSTDETPAIAAGLGAQVYHAPWQDDFSAARNESLRHATGDWIFWIDADDRFDTVNVARLESLLADLDNDRLAAFVFRCKSPAEHEGDPTTVVDHVRLFRRDPRIRWQRRIHERLAGSVVGVEHPLVQTEIEIEHLGYRDPVRLQRKHNRDIRLLKLEYAADPDDPETLFYLGATYATLGNYQQAEGYLKRALPRATPSSPTTRKLYPLLTQSLFKLGRAAESLAVAQAGLERFPDDPELLYERAIVLADQGDVGSAEAHLRRLLEQRHQPYLQMGVDGDLELRARQYLALIYKDQRRFRDAERTLQELLAAAPTNSQAWVCLGLVYFDEQRWGQVDYVIRRLASCVHGEIFAPVLRAAVHIFHREFSTARMLLEHAIALAPHLMWARLLLAESLVREGRDWRAAIQAHRDILELDPHQTNARRVLEQLLQHQDLSKAGSSPWEAGQVVVGANAGVMVKAS
jgi:glycosyltransferase involved in cell wall biosynthesis